MAVLALTGGTGFVGGHTIDEALRRGHEVRALTRRAQAPRPSVHWVAGDLADEAALAELCEGADAVIHIAGIVNARTPAGFEEGNVAGTRRMLAAAETGKVRRFVHVSSLSAREPELSQYGASKARADERVRASGLDWVILRPPAVYGPGDTETVDIYRLAKRGLAVAPGPGRFSLIYVSDLAAALVALAESEAGSHRIFEIADGPRAVTHRDMARLVGAAVGRTPRVVPLPTAALKLGAAADWLRSKATGQLPKLSFDRARYIAHPDWSADPAPLEALGIWAPRIGAEEGIRRTADWYAREGWL
ncbi:epimerase [Pacificimonas flava]|uniref:Epimerase n=2 Tax=Pacificimonas TaxID=1960290 RepID=A0A219B886_9SPHN|nr:MULTISPECIES: NAD(P)-dependent oxidoreductase [Pacificimonas]MBZ6378033.1 NAD(P)-dependent oxidoreductase [Pacificimonas aurantium]OWV34585.1 epimerase [Pacificimonas flava]